MERLLGQYKNSNAIVKLYEDGTKIRETEDDDFLPAERPETMDVCISEYCANDCHFCFVAGTQILMEDFTTKNIEDIQIGDRIIGFDEKADKPGVTKKLQVATVTNTFCHVESEVLSIITTNNNQITATPNHPFLSEGHGANHAMRYSKLENIVNGNDPYVFTFGFPIKEYIDYDSENYKKGYIVGSWCGDGTRCKNLNKKRYVEQGKEQYYYLCRFVTKDQEINNKVMEYTKIYFPEFYFNDFAVGETTVKAVTNATKETYDNLNTFIENELNNNNSKEYACGFLSGIFDSEGHIGKERKCIRISNTTLTYIEETERCLDILGLTYCREFSKGIRNHKDKYNVRVKGPYQWNRFLWYTRPACIRKSFTEHIFDGARFQKTQVTDYQRLEKKQYVYNLETSCHTYIANNFMVHNCYAGCSKNGKHADFQKYAKLLNSIPYLCEMAININSDPHPDLVPFLETMKDHNIIVNATVHQKQFTDNTDFYKDLTDKKLLHGLGISLIDPNELFIEKVKLFPDAIIHVINGIVTASQIESMYDNELKMLILGYKQVGRGIDWYSKEGLQITKRQLWLNEHLLEMAKHFKIISFDNLAVEQLDVKRLVTPEQWDSRFLGEDGTISFYINLVQGYFSRNSLSDIHYPIGDKTVNECFATIINNN